MELPVKPLPENMTDGLANFVAMIHNQLVSGNAESAERMLVDLYNDIGSAYVCEENPEPSMCCPVPDYDPSEDGDYGQWLVSNNID